MTRLSVALAALSVCAAGACWAEAPVPRETVAIKVSTQGLDLNTPEGLAKLNTRIARATGDACSSGNRLNTGLSPDWQCRREMGFDASTKLSALRDGGRRYLASQ